MVKEKHSDSSTCLKCENELSFENIAKIENGNVVYGKDGNPVLIKKPHCAKCGYWGES